MRALVTLFLAIQFAGHSIPPENDVRGQERALQQRGKAAVALFRTGDADALWTLLRASGDNSRRTELIHALAQAGVDSSEIIRQLERETDISARRALILTLGGYADVSESLTTP